MSQYRVPVLEQFEWQQRVISMALATPPGSPAKGDRYVVAASPTGAWASHANHIAWYDGAAWVFDVPLAGWTLWNIATSQNFVFDGTVWGNETHVQGTDQGLDTGGPNAITAAQAKDAYTRRGTYDAALKVILFNL